MALFGSRHVDAVRASRGGVNSWVLEHNWGGSACRLIGNARHWHSQVGDIILQGERGAQVGTNSHSKYVTPTSLPYWTRACGC